MWIIVPDINILLGDSDYFQVYKYFCWKKICGSAVEKFFKFVQ